MMSVLLKAVGIVGKVGAAVIGFRKSDEEITERIKRGDPLSAFFDLGMQAILLETVRNRIITPEGKVEFKKLSGIEKHAALKPFARTFMEKHIFAGKKIGNVDMADIATGLLVDLIVAVVDALDGDELEVKD